MNQIISYLSKQHNIGSAVILGRDDFIYDMSEWLQKQKNVDYIYDNIEATDMVDLVCFDYEYSKYLLENIDKIKTKYLVGRIHKDEDYFLVWEKYKQKVNYIYISREKGLSENEITVDIAPVEILEWERKETDIELSIVLPVYNVAKYLPKCIESLTKWEAPYVEFIFVNDGSTDESEEIISRYAISDSRIRLENKENGGCASARNLGIRKARGRWIGFVDSDDFISHDMYKKLLSRALMGDYDYTYCGYNEFYEENNEVEPVLNDTMAELYTSGTYRTDKVQLLTINTRVAIWRSLYKKELIEKKDLFFHEELRRYDDLPFRVEYILACQSAACVPEHLYYYRLGRKGQDVSCTDERLYVHFEIFDFLDKYVDQFKDKRLKDLLQIIKINTHGYGLSRIERQYKKHYIKIAKQQLNRNMGYWRTALLLMMYSGKNNLWWYTKMQLQFWNK